MCCFCIIDHEPIQKQTERYKGLTCCDRQEPSSLSLSIQKCYSDAPIHHRDRSIQTGLNYSRAKEFAVYAT